ncbi:MAG: peptidase M1, partial [Maribacter sp.]
MKKLFFLYFLTSLFYSCNSKDKPLLTVEIGVSEELANYRFSQVSNVHYDLSFEIPNEQKASIPSKLVLDFDLNQLQQPVYLDFKEDSLKIKSVRINGTDVAILH